MNNFQPQSEKQANKTIKLIKVAGAKLDERIHEVAVQGIAHCLAYGDTTIVSNLSKTMPKSSRGNALKSYITKHLPVVWDNKAHTDGGFKLKKGHGLKDIHWCKKLETVLLANESPFYLKEDKEASVWNPNAALESFIKKFAKAQEESNAALDPDLVEALEAMVANQVTSESLLSEVA